MNDILNQIQKDFEELKKVQKEREKADLIEMKIQELMDLSSQYNTLLYQAIEDESLLDDAIEIKQAMIAKQAEIDQLNKA